MHEDEKGFFKIFFLLQNVMNPLKIQMSDLFFLYLKHSHSDVSLFQDTVMWKWIWD